MKFKDLIIGVPREIMKGERRVAAIPETVKKIIGEGAQVLVERGAGNGSYFLDGQYQEAGALLVEDAEEIYAKADIILKVKEPQFNLAKGKHEVEMMKAGQYLITFIHPASPGNHQMVRDLAQKGVIGLTLDGIPRISRAQAMDALTSMSTVAGYKGVLMAADRLAKFMPMVGTAVGMIKPANVLVIGTGVAGLQAVATAKRMGALVYGADIRPEAKEQAKSLGAKMVELDIPAELAMGEGGYAKKLPDEWLEKERNILRDFVAQSDMVILTALIPGRLAPILLTEEMVKSMPAGAVVVDIAIDQGGNCATTEPGLVVEKHQVSIDGTKNIPGMMPTSSTWMFAHNIYNYLANLVKDGRVELNMADEIIASSLVTRDGKIVHAGALEAMS
ncbi:NAD(P) transhydrogenase subunit alpha [Candidatus Formimonas warabiya]|uniref:proton-translocating NAD(P)(+) transhydrogenase n=1 Tax=Formimonas warabiya TaxID=1761012 RepID=A0A3G1KWF1_FORW1|nr:NAD(P) transhydrogenase subunit alpha [Candidatus Formimonas warabiya]ATW26525.1 NADP oxidoreductase [Candidatus Formimonas warabiya]